MLHSAMRLVARGIQARRSKLNFVRRIKVAWDAPRMKAYRTQLSKGARMAQVRT